jgi:ribosomal protein S18 acetylase RimI-like enzyme
MVAEEDLTVSGYMVLEVDWSQSIGRISHLAVTRKKRRQGIATALVQEAKRWSKVRRVRALVVEVSTKNYPAISFFEKSGFTFCGFNDRCYQNKDIDVFFACGLG